MKNTKNLIITSLTLAIALFTSVQVTAMEQGRKVNSNLTIGAKILLRRRISETEKMVDPKSTQFKISTPETIKLFKQRLERLKEMYYGNKVYTINNIENVY